MMRRANLLGGAFTTALIAAVLMFGCTTANAEEAIDTAARDAKAAVAADVGISLVAIAAHVAVEGNPLALPGIPLTLAVIQHAKTLPPEDGVPLMQGVTAARSFAAGWGLCIAASGGTCIVPALIAGGFMWQRGADERAFYDQCRYHRELVGNPSLRCVWKAT